MKFEILKDGYDNNQYPFPFIKAYGDFINSDKKNSYIIIKSTIGSIPAKVKKIGFLKVLQFLFYPLNNQLKRLSINDEKQFLNDLINFLNKKTICDRIEQCETYALFRAVPDNSIYAPFGTYEIDLLTETDTLFSNVQARYRSAINNASRSGIEIKFGHQVMDDFYSINKKTLERSSMWVASYEYFDKLFKIMKNNAFCAVAYYNGKPEGALFCIYSSYSAYYLYGASEDKVSNAGLIKLLHWEVIKHFKNLKVARYDFVGARLSDVSGTKLDGIQKFKERFGSELIKGYLWKKDLNKMKCKLHDLLVRTSFKFKGLQIGQDIIDQEIIKNNAN